jgi:hypothetical protein
MAQKEQIARRKQELVSQLAAKRQELTRSRDQLQETLRKKLQVKHQAKQLLGKLMTNNPKSLFAGSAVAGLMATTLFRRPRKVKKSPQSTRVLLLGWILSLLKPVAKSWLIARAKESAVQAAAQSMTSGNATRRPRH